MYPLNATQAVPFRRRLLIALGYMLLSGLLLVSGFLVFHLKELQSSQAEPKIWLGRQLQLIAGKGVKVGKTLEVRALSSRGQGVVSSGRVALAAENYPVLEYQIKGLRAQMSPVFFWRRAKAPKKLMTLPLEGLSAETVVLRVAQHRAWWGNIIEFGIGFRRVLPEPVVIDAFAFKPVSVTTLLTSLWSGWTLLEGWSQRSINFLEGGTGTAALALVPATAMWVGLAIVLYGMGGVFSPRPRQWDRRIIGIIFLLGWVAIDSRWQAGLWYQLQETYERYAGKRWKEKHFAAEDAQLFQFISRVKTQLPAKPQRIFLVIAKSLEEDPYTRARARYHLFPHNVYDQGNSLPEPEFIQAGDYVLMLGPHSELPIDAEKQFFQWSEREKNPLVLKRIYTDSMGVLYKALIVNRP